MKKERETVLRFIRWISRPLAVLAAAGFLISFVLHVAALSGFHTSQTLALALFLGAVPVLIASGVVVNDAAARIYNPVRSWQIALRGCPTWMKAATLLILVYWVVFFFSMAALHQDAKHQPGRMLPWEAQFATAFAMCVYFSGMAILYSSIRQQSRGETRLCPRGHLVSHTAVYCEVCGARIV